MRNRVRVEYQTDHYDIEALGSRAGQFHRSPGDDTLTDLLIEFVAEHTVSRPQKMSHSDAVTTRMKALRAAGAPALGHEELERLYQGRMAEVIDFATSNLVGRQAAASARETVQAHREQPRSAGTSSRDTIDPLHARLLRAEARVKSAQISLEQAEEQLKKPTVSLASIESETDVLQRELEDKRVAMLLLSILERKEAIRKQRFNEVLQLLNKLREKVGKRDTVREEAKASPSTQSITPKVLRVEHTRDALASLQSHSIRIARLASLADDDALRPRTTDAEERLLNAIAHSMEFSPDDPVVISKHEAALAAARSRARTTVEYQSPLTGVAPSDEDLEDVSQRAIEKERDLQDLADRAAALTLACARALQADTVFALETAPQLKGALEGEAAAAQGYVDALRLSVVNRPKPSPVSQESSLSGGRSFRQTLSDIEQQFAATRDAESFLQQAEELMSPDPAAAEDYAARADSYRKDEAAIFGRVQRLLERKAAKADAGRALVEDIERLVAEVGIIAPTHV